MRKAIVLTAFDRPHYLQQVVESWLDVRGTESWDFIASIEPSTFEIQNKTRMLFEAMDRYTEFADFSVRINEKVQGVLEHPWMCFQGLFDLGDYEFVVRAEDDLLVSSDILEYFSWAAETYADDAEILTVNAFTKEEGPQDRARRSPRFNPWVWGTWQDRWIDTIGPTWDHDYSTYNGHPGNESGWDWNLDTRVMPKLELQSLYPTASRAQNIGEHGVHGTPSNLVRTSSFQEYRVPCRYREISTSR